jgi:hypothetical protein
VTTNVEDRFISLFKLGCNVGRARVEGAKYRGVKLGGGCFKMKMSRAFREHFKSKRIWSGS